MHCTSRFNRVLAAAVALAISGALCAEGVGQAAAPRKIDFHIAGQPISDALTALGRQSGLTIIVESRLSRGLMATPLSGSYTPDEALRKILGPAGLRAEYLDGKTVAIRPATSGSPAASAARGDTDALRLAQSGAPADSVATSSQGGGATAEPSTISSEDKAADSIEEVHVTAAFLREPSTEGSGSYTSDTVTIGKFPLALREIPNSVSVITRQLLDDQSINTLEDALSQATGITSVTFGDGTAYFQSRGYPADVQYESLPTSSGLQYLPQFDLVLYDRIEVFRGPAGLLQGSGAPGGTLNLVRKRPRDVFSVSSSVSAGSWSNILGNIDVAGPLSSSGAIRGRAVVAAQDGDLFYDNGHTRHGVGYGIIEADLTPNTLLTLSVAAQRDKLKGFSYGQPIVVGGGILDAPRSTSYTPDWGVGNTTSKEGYAEISHHFDNAWIAKLNVDIRSARSDSLYGFPFGPVPANGQVFVSLRDQGSKSDWRGLDMNVSGPFDLFGRRHLLVLGANFASFERYSLTGIAGAPGVDVLDIPSIPEPASFTPAFGSSARSSQYGAYGLTRFKIADPLTLVVGGRVSHYESKTRNEIPAPGPWQQQPDVKHEFTPYGGLIYDVSRRISLYASYADVFVPQQQLSVSGNALDPRIGKQYEAGIKGETENKKLNASLAVFRLKDTNRAVQDPLNPDFFVARGEVRSQGWEAEVSGSPLSRWDIYAGYTYLDTEYVNDPANQGLTFSPEEPRHTLKMWNKYRISGTAAQGFQVGAGVRAVTKTSRGTVYQGGYAVFDAQLGYRMNKNWLFTLNVDNLFDRSYFNRMPSSDSPTFSCCGTYGQPRSVMLTARMSP